MHLKRSQDIFSVNISALHTEVKIGLKVTNHELNHSCFTKRNG